MSESLSEKEETTTVADHFENDLTTNVTTRLNSILQSFSELLKIENGRYVNNRYKYATHYSSYIRNIEFSDYNMEKHLIEFVRIIKYESQTCRTHTEREAPFENSIFKNIKHILFPLLEKKYNEYLDILDYEQRIQYVVTHKKTTGSKLFVHRIDVDAPNDSAKLYQIALNLRTMCELKNENENHTSDNCNYDNYKQIESLFAYYNCVSCL